MQTEQTSFQWQPSLDPLTTCEHRHMKVLLGPKCCRWCRSEVKPLSQACRTRVVHLFGAGEAASLCGARLLGRSRWWSRRWHGSTAPWPCFWSAKGCVSQRNDVSLAVVACVCQKRRSLGPCFMSGHPQFAQPSGTEFCDAPI